MLHLRVEGGIAEFCFPFDPLIERGEVGHLHTARLHGRTLPEQSHRLRQRRETVCAAVLRVEVHELPDFAGVLAGGLKLEMLDEHRRETLDRKSTRLNSSHPSISYAV